jgi:hypothetical protein
MVKGLDIEALGRHEVVDPTRLGEEPEEFGLGGKPEVVSFQGVTADSERLGKGRCFRSLIARIEQVGPWPDPL